jgi:tripartite ATP-independent transporter DctP family solute receptor
MMMLKKFRCLAFVLALILVVVSCSTFAAVKPIKLVFGHIWTRDHFLCKGDIYFKELVEKNSKGKILIDYYPDSQLGNGMEQIQATKNGSQQINLAGPGSLTTYLPKLATFNLPYIYNDNKHILKVASKFTSLIDQNEWIAKIGTRILCVRPLPARHLTTKFPVNKLEDIKGIKMRVPEVPVSVALWKALGAVPTVIPGGETYTSLATGVVEAQENPFVDIYTRKFFEQTKYCALTSHVQELNMMMINNNCWNKLTKTQRKIIQDAADKSNQLVIKALDENVEEYKKMLTKEGMVFTTPNLTPFREKAKTIWSQFGDERLIKKIQAIK